MGGAFLRFVYRPRRAARVAIACVLTIGVLATATQMAEAANAFALSVNYASGSTVLPGAKVNLVSEMPVAQQGTVTQEIVQTIDPLKLKLTASSDITYPSGWTLSVSFDGTNFTATLPTAATGTATSWDKVVKVKAGGPIVSQGESNGYQIAEGSASGTPTTATPPSAALVTAGDPYYSFFDAKRTMVFYIAHHTNGNILGCVVIATNTACNGAPYSIAGVGSDGYAVGKVINNRIWFPGSSAYGGLDGLACLDISTLIANPATGTPVSCGVYPGFNSIKTNLVGGRASQSEQQIWGFQWNTAKFICFDTQLRASCGSIQSSAPPARAYYGYQFTQWGDRLYVQTDTNAGFTGLYCTLISTKAPCPGTFPKTRGRFYAPFVLPNAQGQGVALCYLENAGVCWDANGSSYTPSASALAMMDWTGNFSSSSGTRVISASGSTYRCWDAAANAGAGGWCYSYSSYSALNYTVTQDPLLPECLWISADNGATVSTRDISTNTAGCGSLSRKILTLAGSTAVPRMACGTTGAGTIRAWRTVDLATPGASTYTSVTMSVATTQGVDIAGWQQRAIASWPVDISALDPAATGPSPQFQLTFTNLDNSVTSATIKISAVGDAPQLCLTPQSTLTCPAVGTGLGPITGMPTPTTSTVTSSGSAMDASNITTTMGPVTQTVALGAPASDQCGGQIRGTASLAGVGTAVAGSTVNLLDSSGNVVRDASNNPITSVTDANGNYSFGNLKPGNYKVSFNTNNGTAASATQYTDDGTGATGTNTANATSSTITVATTQTDVVNTTYPAPLTVVADTSSGVQGAVQTKDLTTNDSPSTGATLTKSSVYLCDTGQTDAACKSAAARTKTVSGVGTYSVNTTTGVMTFTPCSGVNTPVMTPACTGAFTGTPSALKYVISDSSGSTASSTYTPTVVGLPTAASDAQTGAFDTNQTYNPAANDTAGAGTTLAPTTVRLCAVGVSAPYTGNSCTATSVTTADGVYTLDTSTGTVTFDPAPTFIGAATVPVNYVVADALGQYASSTITPTVTAPAPSVASPNSTAGVAGATQSVDLLTNDTTPTGVTLTASSTGLCPSGMNAPNCTATTLDVPNVGSYSLSNGTVTFTPCTATTTSNCATGTAFTGAAPALGYQVTDSLGRTVSSSYTPSVVGPPAATADAQTGAFDTNQTYDPAANDTPDPLTTMAPTTLRLCPTDATAPFTATNCNANSVTTADGVYTVDTSTGVVTFDPAPTFIGAGTAPVRYVVADQAGQYANSTITPTVTPPAPVVANPNTTTGIAGATQSVNLLTNDTTPTGVTFAASSTKLCAPGVSAPNCNLTTVNVPNVGTYTLVGSTVTFTPVAGYTGTPTPLGYQVTDSLNRVASSTYTPTVVPPPVASNDGGQSVQGQALTITLLSNDTPGDVAAPLDPSTIRLCGTTETVPNCNQTTVTINGQGTYVLNVDGTVRFTPDPSFTGTAVPLPYVISDVLGQRTTATVTARIVPPPAPLTSDDSGTGPMDVPMTIDPLANDSAGTVPAGQTGTVNLVRNTLRLCGHNEIAPNCTATQLTTADGSYAVDTATGFVTFTPRQGFIGTVTQPVTYQVSNDWTGLSGPGITTAVITLTIDPAAPIVPMPTLDGAPTDKPSGDGSSLLPKTGADIFITALWGAVLVGTGALLGGLHRRNNRS